MCSEITDTFLGMFRKVPHVLKLVHVQYVFNECTFRMHTVLLYGRGGSCDAYSLVVGTCVGGAPVW